MALVKDDLTRIQSRLHDDGTLWSRALLLRYYNEGYRQLLSHSRSTRRFFILDIPGRVTAAGCFEWEDRHAFGGTFRRFSRPSILPGWMATYQWESEQLSAVTPTDSSTAITQLWERGYTNADIDQHFRFYLAAHHNTLLRVAHDGKRLGGGAIKMIDQQESKWWRQGGEPVLYMPSVGRDRTFEVFEIKTAYSQKYEYTSFESGGARKITSDTATRTYSPQSAYHHHNDYAYTHSGDSSALTTAGDVPLFGKGEANLTALGTRITVEPTLSTDGFGTQVWEREHIDGATSFTDGTTRPTYWWETEHAAGGTDVENLDPPLGSMRRLHSPDRQYAPQSYETGELQQLGVPRDFRSGEDSITVLESITAAKDLTEEDDPALIPPEMSKYLRYFTLGSAFSKPGEGMRSDLGQHYMQRFSRGVLFMKELVQITQRDRTYARETSTYEQSILPPGPKLPSTFPRINY